MTTADRALAYIAARAVAPEAAGFAGLSLTENARQVDPTFYPLPALVLPYCKPDGAINGFVRVRYFDPPEVGGLQKRAIRYQQPRGTAPEVYLPRVAGHDWQATLANPRQPLIVTEGEVKALSVMTNTRIPTIGLGGVWMWADHKIPLPILDAASWDRRAVFIVFDSDIDSKIGVQLAEARLAQWLLSRRAVVHTTRLPPAGDGGKMGADDFIAAHGAGAFTTALQDARSLSAIDLRVLEMNRELVWLEGEEKALDLTTGAYLRKDSLTSGSRFATVKVPVQDGKQIKNVSVATAWLTHPMARRYTNTIFRPGGADVIEDDGRFYINSWREQPCTPGDVTPFLDLTRWLFSDTLGEDWDWPVKLLAFKAQNQRRKVPLAIMLIGEQGSGKSAWAAMARSAFGAYGASKAGADLGQEWNGFLESCLLAVVDDVTARQMRAAESKIKNWISEARMTRIEKYLTNREIDNYASLIFTSNGRDAGAFAHDDRRFLVVGAPKRDRGADYYAPLWGWIESGQAGPALYHYLLNYDLAGWEPPVEAPRTAEKRMAYEESLSPFERLARDMVTSDANVVEAWLQAAEMWAYSVIGQPGHIEGPRANDVLRSLQHFPIRPWYTADELCVMFPHMLAELEISMRRWSRAALPGKVSTSLRNHGIYFLRNADNPDGFMWRGKRAQFLIVCPSQSPKAMSQDEFDAAMASMTTFRTARSY